MKALEVMKPMSAEYTTRYEKPVCGPNDVVIKVKRNGICATDMAIYTGQASFMHNGSTSYPVRIGHEFGGDIVEVGENVKEYKVGDKAISLGYVACEKCEYCQRGDYEKCVDLKDTGTINTWPGSYAEYVSFPAKFTYKVPNDLSYDQMALIEPCAIGAEGVKKGHIVPGESIVLIIGVGPIGIAAAALAKYKGAKKVIISGRTQYKLDIAKKMGADLCNNPKEEPLHDFIMRETNGHGCDTIIECSGNLSVIDDCISCLATAGTLVTLAFYEKPCTHFDIDAFTFTGGHIEAAIYHDFDGVVAAMKDGVDFMPLITKHISFDECADFMKKTAESPSKEDIKVMVDIAD